MVGIFEIGFWYGKKIGVKRNFAERDLDALNKNLQLSEF
jgi:hypothetical protein